MFISLIIFLNLFNIPLERKCPGEGFLSLKYEEYNIFKLIDLAKLHVSCNLCIAISSLVLSKCKDNTKQFKSLLLFSFIHP